MKKIGLLYIAILLQCHLSAQWDNQWMIKDNIGKSGIIPNIYPPMNNYPSSNTIESNKTNGGVFSISGYSRPQTTQGKNDFLVIYTDGSYFDTRNTGIHIMPRVSGNPQTSHTTHNFQIPSGKRILAMYTTRNYEGDDPPELVSLANHHNSNGNSNPYVLEVTDTISRPITANHNVVRNRDITLIINLEKLRIQSALSASPYTTCHLLLNQLVPLNGSSIVTIDSSCFNLQPVFSSTQQVDVGGFPFDAYIETPDKHRVIIRLDNDYAYLFLNLRPTSFLSNYYHDTNGNPTHKALFQIVHPTNANIILSQSTELLMDSFDPNFIAIDSICVSDQGGTYVFYHIEFENDGGEGVRDLSLRMVMPSAFDRLCPMTAEWFIGGHAYESKYAKISQSEFLFSPKITSQNSGGYVLLPCKDVNDPSLCKGVLKLKIKLSGGIDYTNADDSYLDPKSCDVNFGISEYNIEIKHFVDVIIPTFQQYGQQAFQPSTFKFPRLIIHGNCGPDNCKKPVNWLLIIAICIPLILALGSITKIIKLPFPKKSTPKNLLKN